ncbi:hypothetical protein OAL24_00877 [Oenococcus sicerae]|nr:hypothetical protein OAL24_00877 [Oenococcus sicerae]
MKKIIKCTILLALLTLGPIIIIKPNLIQNTYDSWQTVSAPQSEE